ncbi:MAG TPA: MarR family winged helix-turn-helix transcriptional regulator [Stellaceae bacterium]|nr:MarR family winged helix-turn-helix transcriptional regulator [Stellaceae bacterium]
MSNANEQILDIAQTARDGCICLDLQRAARAIARRFDAAFRPLDLTNGQFSLLMSLKHRGPSHIGSVATLLAMDRTTLTAALKPLARRGLVNVTVDAADRRGRQLRLTPAGHRLLATALPIWEREHARIDRLVLPPGPENFRSVLRVLS